MEEKVYKSNKISLELLTQLKDAELELGQLPVYLHDYRTRFAYQPIKNDEIDVRLAEFINLHPDRPQLKLLFQRVTEGVYQFGQKKVTMKVENNQLKVRVGGGYLTIDEFTEQYLVIELNKLGPLTYGERAQEIAAMQNAMNKELQRRSRDLLEDKSRRSISPPKKNRSMVLNS